MLKERFLCIITLSIIGFCINPFGCKTLSATNHYETLNKQADLDKLLKKIDHKLITQTEEQLRNYLDERMKKRIGPILLIDEYYTQKKNTGKVIVWDKYGEVVKQGYMYFDAYDILGDEKYLQVALDLADFLLRTQRPKGYWQSRHRVSPSGDYEPVSKRPDCRIQDRFQFGKFMYLLYTYNVTGKRKYLDSALRLADYLLSIENDNGSWPDHWIEGTVRGDRKRFSDTDGVLIGGSYNDGATTDTMEIMIMAYHLTNDPKYLSRIGRIGQWMFDTQMGEGKVRGWCQQYGLDNKAIWARNFEMPHIEPRTFNRFIVPMATWFYIITGQQRYMTLIQETHDWMASVEKPGAGWAYQYLSDGTAVFSVGYKTYRIDQPETWPRTSEQADNYYSHKGSIRGSGEILELNRKIGLEGIRKMYTGTVELSPDEYLDTRIEAARWVLDEKNLKNVRQDTLNGFDLLWIFDRDENRSGYRGRQCSIKWKFLLNVRTAEGKFSPKWLARGAPPFGGRDGHHFKVKNWFDLPPLPE